MIRISVDQVDRLDRFLAQQLPHFSRSKLTKHIEDGLVQVDGTAQKPSFRVLPGMEVTLEEPEGAEPHDLTPADIPLDVRYEDEWLLVVNKPRGLATHPAPSLKEPSLVNALLARGQGLSAGSEAYRPGIVHRLDKETTGLLVIAKQDSIHAALAKQIEEKSAVREYLAIVSGEVLRDAFTVDAPIGRDERNRVRMAVDIHGKRAVTHVLVEQRQVKLAVVRCRLETGRTHQIRVHLTAVGHPILGDDLYAPKALREGPMRLHAVKLEFTHPVSGERIAVEAPPPDDFWVVGFRVTSRESPVR